MSNGARTHSIRPPYNQIAKIRVRQPIRFRTHSVQLGLTKVWPNSPRFEYVVEQMCLSKFDMAIIVVECVVVKLSSSEYRGV